MAWPLAWLGEERGGLLQGILLHRWSRKAPKGPACSGWPAAHSHMLGKGNSADYLGFTLNSATFSRPLLQVEKSWSEVWEKMGLPPMYRHRYGT